MYPRAITVLDARVAIWDLTLLGAIGVGYLVLRGAFRRRPDLPRPRALLVRWLVTVYVSVLGAQLFAYLFDSNTTLAPPPTVGWVTYYLNPLGAPKTLYGAIAVLPISVAVVRLLWRDVGYRVLLDAWTPALMTVLGLARIGCFLQGCCYGQTSHWFGLRFPPDSPPYLAQVRQGIIEAGAPGLPVLPTQAVSATVLLALAVVTWRLVLARRSGVFLLGIGWYSAFRFLIEFVRDDPERNFYGSLATSQWIALLVLGSLTLGAAVLKVPRLTTR